MIESEMEVDRNGEPCTVRIVGTFVREERGGLDHPSAPAHFEDVQAWGPCGEECFLSEAEERAAEEILLAALMDGMEE